MFQTFEFIFNLCPNKNKILELVKIFRGVREHLCVGGGTICALKKMLCPPPGNLVYAVQSPWQSFTCSAVQNFSQFRLII